MEATSIWQVVPNAYASWGWGYTHCSECWTFLRERSGSRPWMCVWCGQRLLVEASRFVPHEYVDDLLREVDMEMEGWRKEIKAESRRKLLEARRNVPMSRITTRHSMTNRATVKIHNNVTQLLLSRIRSNSECENNGDNILVCLLNRSFQYGFELVNIDNARYTQASWSRKFLDGTPLEVTIRDLIAGNFGCQPFLSHEWLSLCLVRFGSNPNVLLSIDNRRLYCLKEYQRITQQPLWILGYMLDVRTHHNMKRFLGHLDTQCCGETINVRS